jgi:hypothetical protein
MKKYQVRALIATVYEIEAETEQEAEQEAKEKFKAQNNTWIEPEVQLSEIK